MSGTGFSLHGLDHISPSQVNLYRDSMAAWTLRYLAGWDSVPSWTMHRGSAVERMLSLVLFGTSDASTAIEVSWDQFISSATDFVSVDLEADRRHWSECCEALLAHVRDNPLWRELLREQESMVYDVDLPDGEITMIGYKDYECREPDSRVIHDLKVVAKTPPRMSIGHMTQGAIYAQGHCIEHREPLTIAYIPDVVFTYLVCLKTPKVVEYRMSPDDVVAHVDLSERTARAMDRYLSLSLDRQNLIDAVVPNTDPRNYYSDLMPPEQIYGEGQ